MTKKLSTPFATDSTLRNDVPVNATSDQTSKGIIGYNNGWTSINKLPLENGGQPPYMEDLNGVLFDITSNISDINKGLPQYYDDAFATLIGGYPTGARLCLSDNSGFVVSTISSNQNNPNTNMTGWIYSESAGQITAVESYSDLSSLQEKPNKTVYVRTRGFYKYNGLKWVKISTETLNPLMFGAVDDKTVDSSDALQAMIDTGALSFDLGGGSFGISKTIYTRNDYTKFFNGRIYVLDGWTEKTKPMIATSNNYCTFENLWGDCNGTVAAGQFNAIDSVKGVNGTTPCGVFIGSYDNNQAHYTTVKNCYGTRSQGGQPVFGFGGIDKCYFTKIIDCTAEFTGSMFFTQSAYNEVINPTCINCNDAGIAFNTGGGAYGKVIGGFVSNCRYGGIAVESNAHNIDITDVTFRQPASNSVMQRGDILFSSFVADQSPCYASTVKCCSFYIDGTDAGSNGAYTYGVNISGGNNINITDNDFYAGDGTTYTGSHHALVFASMDLYDVTNIKIHGNRVNRAQTLKVFGGDTTKVYPLNNVTIKDNIIDTTGQTIYFPQGNSKVYPMGGGSAGILVELNTFVNTAPRLIDGSTYPMPSCGVGLVFGKNTFLNQEIRALYLWDRPAYTASQVSPNSLGKFSNEVGEYIADSKPTYGFWKSGDKISKTALSSSDSVYGWLCVATGMYTTVSWTTGTAYNLDDVVYFNGKSYVCVKAGTAGSTFTEASNLFDVVSDGACSWKYLGSVFPQFIDIKGQGTSQAVTYTVSSDVSIPANSSYTVQIGYSEARNADTFIVSHSVITTGMIIQAYCPSDNNATIQYTNPTTSAITLKAGTTIVKKII